MRRLSVVLLMAILGCGRSDGGATSAGATEEARNEIAEVLRAFEAAELAQDADAVVSLFTEDMVLVRSTLPDVVGRDAWKLLLEEIYGDETVVGVQIVTQGAVVLGDWALTWGTDSIDVVPTDGDRFSAKDDHVIVFQKGEEGWKISRFINSRDVLPIELVREIQKRAGDGG